MDETQDPYDFSNWSIPDWITESLASTGLSDSFSKVFDQVSGGDYPTGGPAAGGRLSESGQYGNQDGMPTRDEPMPEEENVFTRMAGKMGDGISKAYDKNPLDFLKMGLGVVAGMSERQAAREASNRTAQSGVDTVNAKAAADKAAEDRYNASFSIRPPRKVVAKPLTRMDGSRVFSPTGAPQR